MIPFIRTSSYFHIFLHVAQGFRVVQAEECWHKSLVPLMKEIVNKVGKDGKPVYISFDIDSLDPAFAPGYQPTGIHVLLLLN